MTENKEALLLAERLLDEPNVDPDDDLRVLSRQLLRKQELLTNTRKALDDAATSQMIQANRDAILKKYEEAFALISDCIPIPSNRSKHLERIAAILHALAMFHPMHGESWEG